MALGGGYIQEGMVFYIFQLFIHGEAAVHLERLAGIAYFKQN